MSELFNKEEFLKNLIKRVHEDPASIESIRKDFMKVVRELTPIEIAKIEQELVNEGMPAESIQLMCDVHLDVFKDVLSEESLEVAPWHPLHILIEEHRDILNKSKTMRERARKIKEGELTEDDIRVMANLLDYMDEVEKYFSKEENVLFPYLEKHGLVQPPAIMWKEHDEVRALRKSLREMVEDGSIEPDKAFDLALAISELFSNHIYKEHKILFPSALKLLKEEEWKEARLQFDEIGYFAYRPMPVEFSLAQEKTIEDYLNLGSGYLQLEQLKLIFKNLPVDITFVDTEDTVRFFSEGPERIFLRTRAIIGRKVQNCHPQKSVHVVEQILSDFKSGKREVADFWLNMGEKMVYIKYIALKDENKNYAGALEITQDIAPLRSLHGEKRIYDAFRNAE